MWAPFIKCITKIDGTTVDDAEDLNFAMSMYNLLEYSLNYSETIGSLRFYSKDRATNFNADITADNDFKSFDNKVKLVENSEANEANGILRKSNNCCAIKIFKLFLKIT